MSVQNIRASTHEVTNFAGSAGYDYYLQAAREHIINPKAYVSGVWTS